MTQRLCRGVAEECRTDSRTGSRTGSAGGRADDALVDRLCRALFLSRSAQETDDNLAFVRNRLQHSEADVGTLLELYLSIRRGRHIRDDAANPLCSLLRLSGVVAPGRPWLAVRNRVYRAVFDPAWVMASLPGAEVRRQRQAYRRGVLGTGALALAVILIIAFLAASAVKNAQEARSQTRLARTQTSIAKEKAALADSRAAELTRSAKINADLAADRARALAERSRALVEANRQQGIARGNAGRAVAESISADTQTVLARQNAAEAERQKQQVQQQGKDARVRLSRSYVEMGTRLMDTGDDGAALAPFAAAMTLDAGDAARMTQHRRRFAAALALAPRLERLWSVGGPLRWASFSPDKTQVAAAGEDGHAYVWGVATGKPLALAITHAGAITDAAFSPDGTRLVTCGEDNRARVWDLSARRLLWTLGPLNPASEDSLAETDGLLETSRVAWSRDGKRLAAARGSTLTVWNVGGSGGPGHPAPVIMRHDEGFGASWSGVVFAPNGKAVAVIARNYRGLQISVPGNNILSAIGSRALGNCYVAHSVAYSRDGRRLLVAGKIGGHAEHVGACVFASADAGTDPGSLPLLPHRSQGLFAAFSPDERHIVTAGEDGTACVWDAATGGTIARLPHARPVVQAAFSPDGRHIVTASLDATACVWDAATGVPVCAPLHHAGSLVTAQFGADSRHVLTAGRDGTVRLWDLADRPPEPVLRVKPETSYFGGMMLVSGKSHVAVITDRLRLYDLASDKLLSSYPVFASKFWHDKESGDRFVLRGPPSPVDGWRVFQVWDARRGILLASPIRAAQALLSPDGNTLAWETKGLVHLTDPATGRPRLPPLRGGFGDRGYPFSPDGRTLVIGDPPAGVRLLDRRTGRALSRAIRPRDGAAQWAFTPDSRYLFTWTEQKTIQAWNATDGTPASLPIVIPDRGVPGEIAFSPDGRYALSAGKGCSFLWRLDGSRTLRPERFPASPPGQFLFSPDGRTFVAVGPKTWLWKAATVAPVPISEDSGVAVSQAIFSPDSRRVLAVLADGMASVWDVRTGRQVTSTLPQNVVIRAAFSADGTLAATANAEGRVRVWDPETGEALTASLPVTPPVVNLAFAAGRLLVSCDAEISVCSLPKTSESLPRLLARARLLSGQRMSRAGGSVRVAPATLRADWALLSRGHS